MGAVENCAGGDLSLDKSKGRGYNHFRIILKNGSPACEWMKELAPQALAGALVREAEKPKP